MFESNHCPTCRSAQDEEGICTNKKCFRRKLQLKLKAAREAEEKARKGREEQQNNDNGEGK